MVGQLIIKKQRYPAGGPESYGVFLETYETFEGIECWQDCEEIFVAYSWSEEGARWAVEVLSENQ